VLPEVGLVGGQHLTVADDRHAPRDDLALGLELAASDLETGLVLVPDIIDLNFLDSDLRASVSMPSLQLDGGWGAGLVRPPKNVVVPLALFSFLSSDGSVQVVIAFEPQHRVGRHHFPLRVEQIVLRAGDGGRLCRLGR